MFDHRVRELLGEILAEAREQTRIELCQLHYLRKIAYAFKPQPVTSFSIQRSTTMPLLPVAPGFSPVYTATVLPSGTVLNPAQPIPTWTSSDTTNAPVTADSTGLIGTVAIPPTASVGNTFTLTVNYTNADGTTATGTLAQTIVAAPPMDVTGFSITQTS